MLAARVSRCSDENLPASSRANGALSAQCAGQCLASPRTRAQGKVHGTEISLLMYRPLSSQTVIRVHCKTSSLNSGLKVPHYSACICCRRVNNDMPHVRFIRSVFVIHRRMMIICHMRCGRRANIRNVRADMLQELFRMFVRSTQSMQRSLPCVASSGAAMCGIPGVDFRRGSCSI
jgi:hypothetical protein